ncbi:MAG TPA: alkaline phosphatase family protein [Candidatus Paceibacterota bacterium]|nr:alkaline phosphatase family protein [Candidatus Paceibacterota bacterium]
MSKVFVLGIDCAPPEFIFDDWLDELPTIKKLMEEGCYAKLNSSVPPLSIVAWTSIMTGKSPSDTGIFEYVYRKNNSYGDLNIFSSLNLKEKTIWQIASEQGKRSIICLMPLTWPIKKEFNGKLVCGFMTPDTNTEYTYPKELKQEIGTLFDGKFMIESQFRDVSKEKVVESSYQVTDMHFRLIKHFLKNETWDLFFSVLVESDAIGHHFLKFVDKNHRKYDPNSKFKDVMKDYYKYIDRNLGEILKMLDEDTKIIVLSDHGIKRLHNRVNLSDWLIKEGYLVLKNNLSLKEKAKLSMDMVDWGKTRAWAIGAYEGQIFINLKKREPQGVVEETDYEKLIQELEIKLKEIPGDDGKKLETRIFVRKRDYDGKKIDIAPDMIIYFDELQYGCNTSLIGNETLWSPMTAKGSDDAGHSQQGMFIIKDNENNKGNIGEIDVLDVAPTILNGMGLVIPEDMKGKVIE